MLQGLKPISNAQTAWLTQYPLRQRQNGKPSYEDVLPRHGSCRDRQVTYDADKLSLDDILQYYFRVVDPTSLNKQGNDTGNCNTAAACTNRPAEKKPSSPPPSNASSKIPTAPRRRKRAAENFYDAEEYHQDYLIKNPNGYCHIDIRKADEPLPGKPKPPARQRLDAATYKTQ